MSARRTDIARQRYPSVVVQPASDEPLPAPGAGLTVEPTGLGDQHVRLRTDALGVLLDPDTAERLGIDLQIRASYLRAHRLLSQEEAVHGD